MSTPVAALGNRTPEQLKVAELREELRKRGIQIKGLKKDLVDRLEDVLRLEELEQQKALVGVVNAAGAAPTSISQPDPVTPVTKRRCKGHDHHAKEGAKNVVVSEAEKTVVAPAGMEVTGDVSTLVGDIVSQSVVESLPVGSEVAALTATGGADGTGASPLDGEALSRNIFLSVSAGEGLSVETADYEKIAIAPSALEDLVADLERLEDPNFDKALHEEPQVLNTGEQETGTVGGEILSEKLTDRVPAVEKGVDEGMGWTKEVITMTVEKTVSTTVEEQLFSAVSEDQSITTSGEERVVTTTTRVTTMEEPANGTVTTEGTTTTVASAEKTITAFADGEGLKFDMEDVRLLDHAMVAVPKEDTTKLANEDSVAESPTDETLMDVGAAAGKDTIAETPNGELLIVVNAGTEKESNSQNLKETTPMDVNADTQKESKRKEAGRELITLEPTKRRRWNSAKGEGDSRNSGKDVKPFESQESVPTSVAIAPPSVKVQTPKSAPPEKVAITRTAPTRAEASVNEEKQKARVVPPSANPATTSLKIDKFLRPFTFKAVKELLAQTGTVQVVWMDQIKTHCYVMYSSIEEATATRNALFSLQWPPQGGRLLTAEFVDPSEVKLRSDGERAAAATGYTAIAAPFTNDITLGGANSANLKASKEGSLVLSFGQPSTPASTLPLPPPLPFPLRDRSKQEVERTPTLDDLFRKTRSKPHVYYLPLTVGEVADKAAARNEEIAAKPGVKV